MIKLTVLNFIEISSILPRFYDWNSSIVSLVTVTLSNFYLLPERFIFTLDTNFVSEFWPRGTIF
ncbi:hypothetical protein FF021_20010 [Leptospira noguchii]|uniref:Uncharacterized protein n=2 Tax=Leptospira noguchii TaxID=28182 RepID=M6Y353_9LEPT|nr:hypothetical protein [Leptospira noguchii]EMO39873.1 hypothetical protein LEP1GSC186_3110 [Leptospira noguchii serovar Autumnalis str. ZUN142]EMO88115.1 hypothetical protein LEP1GSC024_3914 [Leptospira noguchii str. 2001034031]TQE64014.1 hypothetical protein FF021_20010 [Leptospira noguchii]UOG34993.1 hypothetical protein MAL02_04490 [Leptospira noguchii]